MNRTKKEKVYKLFEKGLTPKEVSEILDLKQEIRVINGCYSYFLKKEYEKYPCTNNEINILCSNANRLGDLIKQTLENLTEIKSILAENYKLKNIRYSTIRQYVMHNIENNDFDTYEMNTQFKMISLLRRKSKLLEMFGNKNKNTIFQMWDFSNELNSKYKKVFNVDLETTSDCFIENRKNLITDDFKNILEEMKNNIK